MEVFDLDYRRYANGKKIKGIRRCLSIFHDRTLYAIFLARLSNVTKNKLIATIALRFSKRQFARNGNELGLKNVKGGICLVHPFGITINSRAHIGYDFTIFKGATVGSIRSGKRKGIPTIGDRVTVCSNAFVCGGITVGDDVLIAANSYVNMDIPSNSVAIGNPAKIHEKDNPSLDYLPNRLE